MYVVLLQTCIILYCCYAGCVFSGFGYIDKVVLKPTGEREGKRVGRREEGERG